MSVRPLPETLQLIAEKELYEVPYRTEEDLLHIKEWIAKQPHLTARTDGQWLVAFLRGCKYSLQRVKEKIDLFYTIRSLVPQYFENRDPLLPEMQAFFKGGFIIPGPKALDDGGRLFFWRAKGLNPEIINPAVVIKALSVLADVTLLEDDNYIVAGVHSVIDLQDIPYKFAMAFTATTIKHLLTITQKSYPIRVKDTYFINVPPYAEPIVRLVRYFSTDKIKKRFHFFTNDNMADLYKRIPLSYLPKEYGGQAGSLEEMTAKTKAKVESYRDWLLEDSKFYSDETKRTGKPITSGDIFGVEGSFRKLEVD